MGKVLAFGTTNKKARQIQRVPPAPAEEYRITAIMITISDLIHNGKATEAERLWSAVRSGGYGIWTLLPADLEKLVEDADYEVGMYGRESDEND